MLGVLGDDLEKGSLSSARVGSRRMGRKKKKNAHKTEVDTSNDSMSRKSTTSSSPALETKVKEVIPLRGLLQVNKSSTGFPYAPNRSFPYVGVCTEDLKNSRISIGEVVVVMRSGMQHTEGEDKAFKNAIFIGVIWPLPSLHAREIILQGRNGALLEEKLGCGDIHKNSYRGAASQGFGVQVMPLYMASGFQVVPAVALNVQMITAVDEAAGESKGTHESLTVGRSKGILRALVRTVLMGAIIRIGHIFQICFGKREISLKIVAAESAAEDKGPSDDNAEAEEVDRFYSIVHDTKIAIKDPTDHKMMDTSLEAPADSKMNEFHIDRGLAESNDRLSAEASSNIGSDSSPWEGIGGLSDQIEMVKETIEWPLKKAAIFEQFGVRPPRGVLLYGPPGTGKTSIARAAAKSCGVSFISISGPDLIGKYVGESEATVTRIFREAHARSPTLIIIDEIDSVCPVRRTATSEAQARLTSTVLALLDGVEDQSKVFVLATTNRPQALDPALRRPGRLDREIEIGIPDEKARMEILKVLLKRARNIFSESLAVEPEVLHEVAAHSHGYVGADLHMVIKEAVLYALRRNRKAKNFQEHTTLELTSSDFESALSSTGPSCLREVSIQVPSTSWEDVGGMDAVKQSLQEVVQWPKIHAEKFYQLGISPPQGVLLYGPPGCSKTLMARALAHEADMNFLAVKGPELLSKFLGESESNMHTLFRRARMSAPSMIFFDEIDAIATARSGMLGDGDTHHDSRTSERMLAQLLHEMDGIQARIGVVVVAATNRPDILDPALLRPGRFDRLVYVHPPDAESRRAIFDINLKGINVIFGESGESLCWEKGAQGNNEQEVLLEYLVEKSSGFSGAECASVIQEAAFKAIFENRNAPGIHVNHLKESVQAVIPQITTNMLELYEGFHSGSFRRPIKETASLKTNSEEKKHVVIHNDDFNEDSLAKGIDTINIEDK